MTEREPGVQRLYPSIFGKLATRYYCLRQLRQAIEDVIRQFVARDSQKLTVADYGCGGRPYESLVAPFVEKYIGIDLAGNPLADILISPEGQIELPEESLDVVLSNQVLEHVVNPPEYLKEALRVLKTDGQLILSTHGYWMFHPDPTDYWRWTSAGLRKVVTDAGFEVVHFRGIVGRAAAGMQLCQDGFTFALPPFLRPALALVFQPLIYLLDKVPSQAGRDKDAATYILVAKKPARKAL